MSGIGPWFTNNFRSTQLLRVRIAKEAFRLTGLAMAEGERMGRLFRTSSTPICRLVNLLLPTHKLRL